MNISKFLSVALSITMFNVMIQGTSSIATTSYDNESKASLSDITIEDLPNYICEAYDLENVVNISDLGATDENSVTFLNNDGTYSLLQFMEPIKYYDSHYGLYRFIDNEIVDSKEKGYKFENKCNSFSSMFSCFSSDGVVFKDSNYSIKMIPLSNKSNSANKEVSDYNYESEYVSYGDVYGSNSELRYYIENSGLKEMLVLNECPEFSTYSFDLQLEGLTIKDYSDSCISFSDLETGEEILKFDPVFIQDSSDNCNTTYNNTYSVESIDYNNYLVTIKLDTDFLNSQKTVYPCNVDPSISYSRMGTISGSYATQSGGTILSNYYQAEVFNGIGECITYVKVNGLENKKWINPNNIIGSSMVFRDCSTGYYNSGTITCYDSNNILNVNNVSYSQLVSSIGSTVDSVAVSSADRYYDFDITYLMKKWISNQIGQGGFTYNYGCIFRGDSNLIGRKAYRDNVTLYPYIEIIFSYDNPIENGIYKLSSAANQKYIQNNGLSQNITATSTTISENGKWKIKRDVNGLYTIQPYNDSNKYLSVSSTNTNLTVSSTAFKWYITANSNRTFRLMPATSTSVSVAATYSSGNIILSDYTNAVEKNWNIELLYFANVDNYFDNGYSVKYGETNSDSQAILNGYMETISDRYRELLGLDFMYTTNNYNSGVDQCKGTVTSTNIDNLCIHTSNHTRYQSVMSSFTSDTSASKTLTAAYWTGHKIDTTGVGRVYDASYNRSFSSGYRIYMLEICDSTNRDYNSKGVLMHELNHQYGAPDHYHEILDNGTCRGGSYCSQCGSNPRPSSCIMFQSRIDITSDNVICDGCKGQMITHLEGHHIN